MFVNKEEKLKLQITNFKRLFLFQKVFEDNNIKMGDILEIPWYYLKTSSLRRYKLKLKCDECGKDFYNRIENLDENINNHYCPSCSKKSEKNPLYGKTPWNKDKKFPQLAGENNPAKRKGAREKISKAKKGQPSSMLGKHHSEKSKIKISNSNKIAIKDAWESGKLSFHSKYANSKIKLYKNIKYQGSYELDFLKEMEKLNVLNLVERGPAIYYIDKNKKERIYLIDYRIKNILIEIKSSYTMTLDKKNICLKENYANKYGDYTIILDKNYLKLKEKLKKYEII
jgi:hypothetical protein